MLNAEQIALQSRLVQQMVAMREREMTTILERYTAIGTQSSLLAGFAITSLTALDPVGKKVDPVVTYLFFIFSLVCVLSCMHVIMCTMYICNWAPRLALRGPSGSLQRSFVATKSEKTQINAVFTLGVMSFAVQTVLAIWVMDDHDGLSPHAAYATALTTVVLVADLWYHKRIHSRFFGEGPLELPEAERHYTRAAQPAPLPRGGAAGGDGSINTSCGAGGGLQGGGSGRRGQGGGLRTRLLDGASGQAAVAAAGGGAQPAAADDRRGSGPATTQRRGSIPAGSGSSGGAAGGGGAGSGGGGGLDDIAVRDNTMAAVCAHPDIASQHESNVGRGCGYGHGQQHGGDDGMVGAHAAVPRAGVVLLNDFDLMGMLQKRALPPGQKGTIGERARSGLRRMASTVNESLEWSERWFALRNGRLEYWHTEADYHECRPAAVAPVDLADYEILVDLGDPARLTDFAAFDHPGDHKWGFTLQPATNDGRRVWHLRASSEAARYEWSRRLVLATVTGN